MKCLIRAYASLLLFSVSLNAMEKAIEAKQPQAKYQRALPKLTSLGVSNLAEICDPKVNVENALALLSSEIKDDLLAQALKLEIIKKNQPILWKLISKEPVCTRRHGRLTCKVFTTFIGKELVSCSMDRSILFLDLDRCDITEALTIPLTSSVTKLAKSHDEKLLAVALAEGATFLIDVASKKV